MKSDVIHLTDNLSCGKCIEGEQRIKDVLSIADQYCLKNNPDILVFPHSFAETNDGIGDLSILRTSNLKFDSHGHYESIEVKTGNLMGFVGVNDSSISIHSRFVTKNGKSYGQDFFLYYMLQKVLSINVFNLEHSTDMDDNILDFLIFLFPCLLKDALSQGIFKEYQTQHHDDARVKGVIEVNKFIRNDMPFRGRISYSSRQHSYDNSITQLIRHTIEYIKSHPFGASVLSNDQTTKECVSLIEFSTPSYSQRNRGQVLKENSRPKVHPYFLKYRELQQLCLRILRHDSLKYGDNKDKVHGILFDGSWLWEEYLNTILRKQEFFHPRNKESKGGIRMFAKSEDENHFDKCSRRMYPDFYKRDHIVDAKYKHLDGEVGREDLYQVVSYMYCMNASFGGYIYPDEGHNKLARYKLAGMGQLYNPEDAGGIISVIPFHVPQKCDEWSSFIRTIEVSENKLIENINS